MGRTTVSLYLTLTRAMFLSKDCPMGIILGSDLRRPRSAGAQKRGWSVVRLVEPDVELWKWERFLAKVRWHDFCVFCPRDTRKHWHDRLQASSE